MDVWRACLCVFTTTHNNTHTHKQDDQIPLTHGPSDSVSSQHRVLVPSALESSGSWRCYFVLCRWHAIECARSVPCRGRSDCRTAERDGNAGEACRPRQGADGCEHLPRGRHETCRGMATNAGLEGPHSGDFKPHTRYGLARQPDSASCALAAGPCAEQTGAADHRVPVPNHELRYSVDQQNREPGRSTRLVPQRGRQSTPLPGPRASP